MTRVLPLERLTERSAENPSGVLFRDFAMTVAPHQREDGSPVDGAIEIAISSEAPVLRYDWRTGTEYFEVLDHAPASIDLSYVADGIPFCLDHWLSKQIGIGETVSVSEDRKLRAVVRRGSHPDAAWVFADMANGVRKKVSVGYDPGDAYIETKGEGDEYATRRYTRWMPYEASSVAVPADYGVGVGRSAAGALLSTEAAKTARNPESVMTDEEKAALARGNAATVDTSADLRAEQRAIAALAKQHGRESDLAGWVMDGLSLEQVRDKILTDYTRADANKPQINSGGPKVERMHERAEDKPFESLTEFFREVKTAAAGVVSPRLAASTRAATGMGIGTDADGGFMVPEQFASGVVTRAFTGGKILSRVKRVPVSGNQYHMTLIDETSRVSGSQWGGVRAYRIGEGTAPTVTKPKTRRATLDVTKKIGVAVWASEEQLEDAPATDTILSDAMSQVLTYQLESEIWSGIGGAQCLGFTTGPAFKSVTKKSGQTAATFVAENATAMNAALWAGSHGSAAWFINQMILGQLPLMVIGQQPVWLPPTGLAGSSPFGTLLGKPIEVVEYASVLGTVGDSVLADLSQYVIGEKANKGLTRSIHVKFLEGEEVFRQIVRVDGLPLWNSTLTLADGSTTVSPFVGVETRS